MNDLSQIDWGIIAPLIVIQLILALIGLIDWLKKGKTNGPRWMWLLFILFVTFLGPILYFTIGKRQD